MDSKRIDRIIDSWILGYSRRLQHHERPEALLRLIKTFKLGGLEPDDINMSTKLKIVEVCTSENAKGYQKWKKIVFREIEFAIATFNPEEIADITEEDIKIKAVERSPAPPPPPKEETQFYPEMDRSIYKNLPKPTPVDMDDLLQELGLEDE